jgi:hypothetical protein
MQLFCNVSKVGNTNKQYIRMYPNQALVRLHTIVVNLRKRVIVARLGFFFGYRIKTPFGVTFKKFPPHSFFSLKKAFF